MELEENGRERQGAGHLEEGRGNGAGERQGSKRPGDFSLCARRCSGSVRASSQGHQHQSAFGRESLRAGHLHAEAGPRRTGTAGIARRAIEIRPHFASGEEALASAYEALGNSQEALAHWRKAHSIDPSNVCRNSGHSLGAGDSARRIYSQWSGSGFLGQKGQRPGAGRRRGCARHAGCSLCGGWPIPTGDRFSDTGARCCSCPGKLAPWQLQFVDACGSTKGTNPTTSRRPSSGSQAALTGTAKAPERP